MAKRTRTPPRVLPFPDFDKLGRGCRIVTVTCLALKGKPHYDANLCDWHKIHGFICTKCGMSQPLDCPDHKIEGLTGRPRKET